jgi:two-component sensor histidine kinase
MRGMDARGTMRHVFGSDHDKAFASSRDHEQGPISRSMDEAQPITNERAETEPGVIAPPPGGRARRWLIDYPRAVPLAIFITIAAITLLSVFAIESNARTRERAQMREYAQGIASALDRRGNSFSAYLRAGSALFAALDEVSPQRFESFATTLQLDVGVRGAEGIGWIAVTSKDDLPRLIAETRRQRPNFPTVRPPASHTKPSIAPVMMFSPRSAASQRSLGYDMYSDPVRAAAMEEAARLRRPVTSGRIQVAQSSGGYAPGFIIFMPVLRSDPQDGTARLSGFVYAPFNARTFLDSAIESSGAAKLGVRLYDGEAGTDHLLVAHSLSNGGNERIEQDVTIANRRLILVVEAPGPQMLAPLSMMALFFGLALASLVMLLARLLTQQAYEDQKRLAFFEEQHSIRNSLSRELNHRVKNTLANVLSILSLTRRRTNDLDEFADSLEGRIRALSATHDLLTGTDWGTTPIRAVIEAELQHCRTTSEQHVTLEGPALELAPNDALSFGLAVHELATNAAKYGALSVPGGAIAVNWTMIDDHLAEVVWRERGGPLVAPPHRRGFGTELIEKIVAHELRYPVKLDFAPEGVSCVMRVPVRRRGDFRIRA